MPKYANSISYTGRQANSDHSGAARFASDAEVQAGLADDLIVSPDGLQAIIDTDATFASASDLLVPSQLATKTYADNLAIAGAPDASETVKGIAELATTAETVAYTDDERIVTPLKVAAAFAAPPAMGSGTPAAGSFTTIAASGLSSLSASATILTAGVALNLGSDNDAGAVNLGVGTTARAIGIGSSAAAHVVTVGSVTGASQVILNSGTAGIQMASTGAGDITINSDDTLLLDADGVLELNSSAGVIGIGSDADAQNINVGTGAAARVITVGNSTGATSVVLDCGTGALDLGTNAIAHSVTIGNNTGATAVNIDVGTGNFDMDGVGATTYAIGASTTSGTMTIGGTAQTGTLSIGDSSGIMTLELGAGEGATAISIGDGATAANAVTIATGAVANTVAVGSASAGAISVDTAAGISLDAATASNFTLSGAAADLTLQSSAGRVVVKGEEAAVSAVELVSAAGGISASSALQLSLISSEAAVADSVRIQASAADGGIDCDAGTGGIAIDTTGALSLQAAAASDYSVSGAGIDLTLTSAAGRVVVNGEEAAANAITLLSAAGGIDADAALEFNIASSQAAATAISLTASDAAGGISLTAGTGGIVHVGKCVYTPDAITSTSAGVAASVATVVTEITTNGDSDLDNVTLANGVDGQVKIFAVVAVGNAADSVKITPASMIGGTIITFAANPLGLGCQMYYDAGAAGWIVTGNNGGTVS